MSYYENELKKLNILSNNFSMKIVDSLGNETKWLDINADSIKVIEEFLSKLKELKHDKENANTYKSKPFNPDETDLVEVKCDNGFNVFI